MTLRIYGNKLLKTLPGLDTRPTSARVREAVFNIWRSRIADCRWLDLCAGNGSMGAEALCRGASLVVGIEQSSRACAIIKQNWQQLAQPGQTFQVLRGDVVQRLKTLSGQFDLIYFDPPYTSDLYKPVLETITSLSLANAHYPLLTPGGELAVEHSPNKLTAEPIPSLEICRQKVYGNTAVTFYTTNQSS